MADRLELRVFGLPGVLLPGRSTVKFISQRAQALLLYLAETGQIHPREELATLLWPLAARTDRQTALKNVRDALSSLRPFFESYLLTDRATLAFNRMVPHWMDSEEFRTVLDPLSPTTPLQALQTTLDLYQGEFFQGFSIEQTDSFDEWIRERREYYRNLAIIGSITLLDRLTNRGATDEAIKAARRLLTLEPASELAMRRLLQLLPKLGQHEVALQQYEQFYLHLEREYEATPAPDLIELAERVRRREVEPATSPKRETRPIVRNNLPRVLTSFLGRKREIEALRKHIVEDNAPLVTIAGEGGMGKSRLAVAVAAQLKTEFEDGVWFIPLAEIVAGESARESIAAAVARAMGITFSGSGALVAQLFDYLQNRKILLILDNFEHLVAESDFVLDLLKRTEQIKVVVTSRERLNFQFELPVRLEGLGFPRVEDVSQLSSDNLHQYESVQLFLERAMRARPGYQVTRLHLQAIADICRMVEGMPLAIELAAALVERQNPPEIIQKLERSLTLLTSSLRDLPERQRSMRAVLDYGWQLLGVEEQQVMKRCSVFQQGFSSAAARAVTTADLVMLKRLESKSLLRQVDGVDGDRFDMHELVRQYAAEQLDQSSAESENTADRHAAYYADFLQQITPRLGNESAAFHVANLDAGNLLGAWMRAVDRAQLGNIEKSFKGLFQFFSLSGKADGAESELRRTVRRVQTLLENPARETSAHETMTHETPAWQRLLAELLIQLAAVCEVLGKQNEGNHATEHALQIAHTLQDDALLARAYLRLSADIWAAGDDYQAHRDAVETALNLAQKSAQPYVEVSALSGLGNNVAMNNEYSEAIGYYERAVKLSQKHHFLQMENILVSNLGVVFQLTGDFAQAQDCFERSLTVCEDIGDHYGTGLAFANLGMLANALGDFGGAQEHLEKALDLFTEIGSRRMEGDVLANIGLAYHYLGDQATAIEQVQRSLAIANEHDFPHVKSLAYLTLGRAYESTQQAKDAASAYQRVVELKQTEGPTNETIVALSGLARLALVAGDLASASEYVETLLPMLDSKGLYAGPDLSWVYLTCYRVLLANQDGRTQPLLQRGLTLLTEQASKIGNRNQRRTFLENIAANRELLEVGGI